MRSTPRESLPESVAVHITKEDDRTPPTPSAPADRSCGACRACCRVFDIHELDKPRNVLCRHADRTGSDAGCAVYASRPPTCRDFECAWKQGLAGDDDRPDLIGVMFYLIPLTDGAPGLGVIELEEGAFGRQRPRDLIAAFEARKPGRILARREADDRFRPASIMIEGKPLRPRPEVVVRTETATVNA